MLDRKDQIILEYLMHNCRVSTTFLSKVTKLSQPAVVRRIKNLESKGHISKYDAIVNFPQLKVPAVVFLLNVPKDKTLAFEKEMTNMKSAVSSLFHILHKYNYFVLAFIDEREKKAMCAYFKKQGCEFVLYTIEREEFMPFSIFDVPIKIPFVNKPSIGKVSVDAKDVKLMNVLSDGGGRDSMLELARKTGLSYDVVLYRFRKLCQQNMFPLFLAQPASNIFGLQVDMLIIKTKNESFNKMYQILETTKKTAYLVQLAPNTYFTQLFTKSFVEYKEVLSKIRTSLGDEVTDWQIFNTNDWVFINRTPFEKLIGK